jgi:hypothetical protein
VFFFRIIEYENVINEYYNKFVQVFHKHIIHEIHEIGCVFVSAKDITVYSYNAYQMRNAIFGISDSRIFN